MGTLDFYDSDPERYVDRTFGADMSESMGRFVRHLREGSRILDLGSGSCRDTLAFRDMGFDAVPADASEGMRRVARERLGVDVLPVEFSSMDLEGFDAVWANASLLHVPSAELPDVFSRVRSALSDGGVFYCSFKHGGFEGERDGRHYTDMVPDVLEGLLRDSGFVPIELWVSEGSGFTWTNAVSKAGRRRPCHRTDYSVPKRIRISEVPIWSILSASTAIVWFRARFWSTSLKC